MAANTERILLAAKNSQLQLGAADDAMGTYSLGSLRGKVHAISFNRSWMKSNRTAIGDGNTSDFKTVTDESGSVEWLVNEANYKLANTLYKQDSTKNFPLLWGPFGDATGKTGYPYLVEFGDFNESVNAEEIVVINQSFKIQVIGDEITYA